MKLNYALLWLCLPLWAFASPLPGSISAARLPDESFAAALERVERQQPIMSPQRKEEDSALALKVPEARIDFGAVPSVESYEALLSLFQTIRDKRFLKMFSEPKFMRRITWLYPDDGCYARAAMGGLTAAEEGFIRPAKLYAFGSLYAATPFSPSGYVTWWFHVALAIKYQEEVYVIDPAIESDSPLSVTDWFNAIRGDTEEITGVVCNTYSFDPHGKCLNASEDEEATAKESMEYYLPLEWMRVRILGYNPHEVLGEAPPWKRFIM